MQGPQATFHIGELSEIAAARRAGNELARSLGFAETLAGQLAIVVTEAGTNIVKHAGEGEILLRTLRDGERLGVEAIAIDCGPGMANVSLHMQDGHSTTGTYGAGLGAISRLAHEFDIYSMPGQGTVLLMRLWNAPDAAAPPRWQVGAVCLPLPSETECGDAWGVTESGDMLTVAVADGLGHGPVAAIASQAVVEATAAAAGLPPGVILQRAHAAAHGTRGAAAAILSIDTDVRQMSFAGVGNIAGCIFSGTLRQHLLSHNGIVGSNLRKVQEFTHAWSSDAVVVLHSDGIGTRWDLGKYPGLVDCHPALVAAVLYRDFARQRDDATVLVIREGGQHR